MEERNYFAISVNCLHMFAKYALVNMFYTFTTYSLLSLNMWFPNDLICKMDN